MTERFKNTIENGTKDQRRKFLGMLLGVLGVVLLENLLVGKGVKEYVKMLSIQAMEQISG